MQETAQPNPRAILVGLDITSSKNRVEGWTVESSLLELERLATTAHVDIAGRLTQRLPLPDNRSFIGSGKVKELKSMLEAQDVKLVIFDDELSPRQQVNLQTDLSEKDALEEDRVRLWTARH